MIVDRNMVFLLAIWVQVCAIPVSGYAWKMTFPDTAWEESSPKNLGVNSTKLVEALNYLGSEAGGAGVNEMVVVRYGYLIWKGSASNQKHSINSCTKTFTTTAFSLLVGDGKLTLDSLAKDYSSALSGSGYWEYQIIKFRHFASMTSGYHADNTPVGDMEWGDPEKFLTPEIPMYIPGNSFKYHDPAVHQFGYILTHVAGESLKSLFKRRIADPIKMKNWDWTDYGLKEGIIFNNPSGIYEGGIHISARELARFGHLFLNRGRWNGNQLISADLVDQATSTQVPASISTTHFDLTGRYGFMWWTNGYRLNNDGDSVNPWPDAPEKTYTALGGFRNYCFVIPEWNMVIVRTESSVEIPWSKHDTVWNTFFKILGGGVTLPPDSPTGFIIK